MHVKRSQARIPLPVKRPLLSNTVTPGGTDNKDIRDLGEASLIEGGVYWTDCRSDSARGVSRVSRGDTQLLWRACAQDVRAMREVVERHLVSLEGARFEALRDEWRSPAQLCLGLRDVASRTKVGGEGAHQQDCCVTACLSEGARGVACKPRSDCSGLAGTVPDPVPLVLTLC